MLSSCRHDSLTVKKVQINVDDVTLNRTHLVRTEHKLHWSSSIKDEYIYIYSVAMNRRIRSMDDFCHSKCVCECLHVICMDTGLCVWVWYMYLYLYAEGCDSLYKLAEYCTAYVCNRHRVCYTVKCVYFYRSKIAEIQPYIIWKWTSSPSKCERMNPTLLLYKCYY